MWQNMEKSKSTNGFKRNQFKSYRNQFLCYLNHHALFNYNACIVLLIKLKYECNKEKNIILIIFSYKNWFKNPRLNFSNSQASQVLSDGNLHLKQRYMRMEDGWTWKCLERLKPYSCYHNVQNNSPFKLFTHSVSSVLFIYIF